MTRIAVDTGGTFTDCVHLVDDRPQVLKLPSTPRDPGQAVLQAIEQIAPNMAADIRHGTTVGTNALLERTGARVAFVTTEGFEDTIAIGRQTRPKLYDLFFHKESPLAPRDLRFGVVERTACDGNVLRVVDSNEIRQIKEAVAAAKPEAIAVSLLFAFANPANEREVAAALRELGVPVSVSHEILPEFREYERGSTVLINAYLAPKMQSYVNGLDNALANGGHQLQVMQSSGGIIPARIAAREPVRTILSGPAGGVVGAFAMAQMAGFTSALTFDMGGTSTDVACVKSDAGVEITTEAQVLGMPVAVPMLNIHTVGAGGGSIARFDRGGALQVGPQSAGADPGPICYGRGEQLTVTDANLLLGRLDPEHFLGGAIKLNEERVQTRFAQEKGNLANGETLADGIIQVANAHMEKALRKISIEQGHDPRASVLVSFGGAGPLHACALARALHIATVLVPNFPGALSAYGILVSDVIRDYSRTVMLRPGDDSIHRRFSELQAAAKGEMDAEGMRALATRSVDLRYAGQAYEIAVDWSPQFLDEFHRKHAARYGYSDANRPVEIVNMRVRMVSTTVPIVHERSAIQHGDGSRAILKSKRIYVGGSWLESHVYDRKRLLPGDRFQGPAVVAEYSATTFLPQDAQASVDEYGNLLIAVSA
jgi:N-methylhydantoinase A